MPKKQLTKEDVKKMIPNWQARDAEMVTGIFENKEAKGQSAEFNLKLYPGDEFRLWYFEDGEKYTVPRGVARYLNTQCYFKEYKTIANEFNTEIKQARDGRRRDGEEQVTMKIHRYAFKSLDFSDDDYDMTPSSLIEVVKQGN